MVRWLPTAGAVLLAVAGLAAARWVGHRRKSWWAPAYALSLLVVAIFGVARWSVGWEMTPPFSWVASGRARFLFAAVVGPVLLLTPAAKLPRRRERTLIFALATLFQAGCVVMPFFLAALSYPTLAALKTKVDADGVCLQQTAYTCSAASAATALRRLGAPADEGQIAIWCRCGPYGTDNADVLEMIREHYSQDGVTADYRSYNSVAELRGREPLLAVMKYDWLTDHMVAVLSVTATNLAVGDPLDGLVNYSYDDFSRRWRGAAITLSRTRAR